MKKAILLTLALAVVFVMCSCGGSLAEKWAFGVNTYEFRADGTVSISINGTLNYDGTYKEEGGKIALSVTSALMGEKEAVLDYKLAGNKLTLSGDVTLSGSTVEIEFTKTK